MGVPLLLLLWGNRGACKQALGNGELSQRAADEQDGKERENKIRRANKTVPQRLARLLVR